MKNNSKNISKRKTGKTADWEKDPKLEAPIEDSRWDAQLSFASHGVLESLGGNLPDGEAPGDFFPRDQNSHLKDIRINLGELDLTDRQLMAVSLVFYGGVKKNRAARAMQITSQALTDHINAALKKISRSLA
ncbi:MAG: hypothetical protein NPINA01_18090 [Nitrospinaceae bacterium]|nr:MAG: hypothetical protein NPINA01_18090 [Nitrospinaceae bacterium]